VGVAYHAGVLRALKHVAGVDPASADLIVGSSAGSVVGAYLRSGVGPDELYDLVCGTHPSLAEAGRSALQTRAEVWAPVFGSPLELGRRMLGSSYVLGRTALPWPAPRLPVALQRVFPAGLFSMEEGRRRLEAELPASWPSRALWLCAVDIGTGRRVVLGRHGPPRLTLPQAVTASCAIPGVYRPVRLGRMTLIDGGVFSTSNLDLATGAGRSLIIGVVPLSFDGAAPPCALHRLARSLPTRRLAREVAGAEARGAEVLLLRPTGAEVAVHGIDLMRPNGLEVVARMAYEASARTVGSSEWQRSVAALAA